ncbi:hypothetical protein K443DRAFT_131586 [Laccaria amethystina LaAM-08-1]|uniref:Uncharacterized protein n=1 Tax=Laccaria amethystina LaAM-08-1 TaxID=1095629 RepID=A0A0C9XNM2_9AGAR|nr:hypothetical protein K443DRAFT_131586 [Laccaria amethystina LaAM-08-1]
MCGAPAPRTSLPKTPSNNSRGKKVAKFTSSDRLLFTTAGDRLPSIVWCSGCRDGGKLVLCTICKCNAICSVCIEFGINDGVDNFKCPTCFMKESKNIPYPWKFQSCGAGRENWPKIDTSPLAIISIHLQGMTDSPSILTYHHLAPWLHGNLVLIDLMFNFDDPKNNFNSQMECMLHEFEEGQFKDWSRFLVIITTHSDPDTGFLHIAPGNTGSVPANELFAFIFQERFRNILQRQEKNKNILNLLSCGALSSLPSSRDAVKDLASEKLFDRVLCFSQPSFQPSFTHRFVMDLASNYFILDRINLIHILQEQQTLGAHTDVILFNPKTITTFHWTHPGARPMGNYTPDSIQCPACLLLKSTSPTSISQLPEGFNWCQGEDPTNGLERGAWISTVEAIVAKTSDDKMEVN